MNSPTIEDFASEAERFLSDWPLKPERRGDFEWGNGGDDVSIFEESDPEVESAHLDEVRHWRHRLADAGYAWISGPVEYGGRGLPRQFQLTFDALARVRKVPGNGPLTVSLGMVAPTILVHGSEVAKQRYLEAMHTGDTVGCQLFSEPGAGSDLASVSTKARRDGDGWRLSGQKVWTSGAHLADIGEALCKTSDGPRHHNLTVFVIDMHAPGVTVRALRQMTGGASFNEVFLENVWVADEYRLGEPNDGWSVAMTTLTNERGAIGGGGFGGKGLLSIERLKALLHHTGRNVDPLARQEVAQLIAGLRTATWTRQRLADSGARGSEASMLKLALCRDLQALERVVTACLGSSVIADTGEWGTYAWSHFVLGLPGYRIGGGTDEVLKTVIAERVLGLPKEPAS
jgi:alkylation response protein AidB-like acyl-CoA dehydrogenase